MGRYHEGRTGNGGACLDKGALPRRLDSAVMVAGGDEGEGEGYQKRDDVICVDQMVLPNRFDMNDSLQQNTVRTVLPHVRFVARDAIYCSLWRCTLRGSARRA